MGLQLYKKSRWIIAEKYRVGARSKRFLVEINDEKVEIAARTMDLLVFYGNGVITSSAFFLALEEGVNIVLIGDGLVWMENLFKDVEYLLSQYYQEKGFGAVHAVLNSYIKSARYFLSRNGVKVSTRKLVEIGDPEEKYKKSIETLENAFIEYASNHLGYSTNMIDSLSDFYFKFLKAEVLNGVLRAGLNPHLSLIENAQLYELLALELKPPLVWESIIRIRDALIGELDSKASTLRRVAAILKNKLENPLPGHKISYRYAMLKRIEALAVALKNPLLEYKERIWK